MSRRRQILIALSIVMITGIAISEHLYRRMFEDRYTAAVAEQGRLEGELKRLHLSNADLRNNLAEQSTRSDELAASLDQRTVQLNQALARLSEENKTIRDLQARLDLMQSQMEHLQGELLVAIDRQVEQTRQSRDDSVRLERVVVSKDAAPGLKGKVISVHTDWSFVIVDLGWDAVSIGDTISIYRDEKLLGEARIERVQEGLSAATLLPDWNIEGIQVNDSVNVF